MRSRRRLLVAGLAFVNALVAFGGAVGLATGALALEGDLNRRLPFASPVVGGVAVAVIVALPLAMVAVLAKSESMSTTWRFHIVANGAS